jgi:hypothetical protein
MSQQTTDGRRAALNAGKLAALVDARWGADGERRRLPFGSGAGLVGAVHGTPTAWVLVDQVPGRSLGPALLWAEREGAAQVHLVVEEAAGVLARQASYVVDPVPGVWRVEGRDLVAAAPDPVPVPLPAPAPTELVDLLLDAGLDLVAEGGSLRGELNGLEVARVVTGTSTAGVPLDAPLLEVGVGKADRELTAMLHGALDPVDQLGRVVEIVRAHRTPGAEPHPLNQMVPERWLRAVLCRDPAMVGLATLRPAEGAQPRTNLRDRDIAVAAGETPEGEPVVVACAVGVAPDMVPVAADARGVVAPSSPLILVVPERDDVPGNRRLTARLRTPAEVRTVPTDWRR